MLRKPSLYVHIPTELAADAWSSPKACYLRYRLPGFPACMRCLTGPVSFKRARVMCSVGWHDACRVHTGVPKAQGTGVRFGQQITRNREGGCEGPTQPTAGQQPGNAHTGASLETRARCYETCAQPFCITGTASVSSIEITALCRSSKPVLGERSRCEGVGGHAKVRWTSIRLRVRTCSDNLSRVLRQGVSPFSTSNNAVCSDNLSGSLVR